jgi:hypothetical protein
LKEASSCDSRQLLKLPLMTGSCSPKQRAASEGERGRGAESSDSKGLTFSSHPLIALLKLGNQRNTGETYRSLSHSMEKGYRDTTLPESITCCHAQEQTL